MTTHTNNTWPDEHDYSNLWPVAPSWARYIVTTAGGHAFYSEADPIPNDFGDMGVWQFYGRMQFIESHRGNGDQWRSSKQEIPERERELNRLAEYNFKLAQGFSAKFGILQHEINERVRQRIEAGLIDGKQAEDDDGVAAALDEKAAEMAEAEPAEWVPEVGSKCKIRHPDEGGFPSERIADFHGYEVEIIGICEHGGRKVFTFTHPTLGLGTCTIHGFVEPETPKQKAERERSLEIQKMYEIAQSLPQPTNPDSDIKAVLRENDENVVTALYDAGYRLKSEGKV